MTLPDERYRAVLYAEEFLRALANPTITKRVPKDLRQRARGILRHYPSTWEMQQAAEACPSVFAERMEDVTRLCLTKFGMESQKKCKRYQGQSVAANIGVRSGRSIQYTHIFQDPKSCCDKLVRLQLRNLQRMELLCLSMRQLSANLQFHTQDQQHTVVP